MGPLMAGQLAYVTHLRLWWGEASVIARRRPAPFAAAAKEDARRFTVPEHKALGAIMQRTISREWSQDDKN